MTGNNNTLALTPPPHKPKDSGRPRQLSPAKVKGKTCKAALLALAVVTGIALLACQQAARPPATGAGGSGSGGAGGGNGGAGGSPTAPAPTPAAAAKSWPLGEDAWSSALPLHAAADPSALTIRSEPFAWDGLTGADGEKVSVSIGGNDLPFTSTATAPAFAGDLSGAQWTIDAEVSAGAIVLVLTAPDQSGASDTVESVTITERGSGYTSVPTVTLSAPPAGGTRAIAAVAGGGVVGSVNVTTAGAGYVEAPTISFTGGGSSGAAATADVSGSVTSVTVDTPGSGYTSAPTVSFSAAPAGGTTATGTASLRNEVNSVTITSGGSGYTSVPTVTFGAPRSAGALPKRR